MTLEETIIKYVHTTEFRDIDPIAIETAQKSIIDVVGVSIAGAYDSNLQTLGRLVEKWGGVPECGVLGRSTRLPAPMAALLNGAAARVLDYDDVVDPLGTHPSVAIFPPLLAIAELRQQPVEGRELLSAMVLGQDLSVRLARARRQTLLESGRYDLSKLIAATAAAGKLYGLDEQQLQNAMGIAYTSALGETQCMVDGASTVYYQQGLVASHVIKAVLLSAAGFTGARNFLTGRWGYYNAFEPDSNLDTITQKLGQEFTNIEGIAFKPYPTCRPNISAAALVVELTDGLRLSAADVERIDVYTNKQIFDLVCDPIKRKQKPTTVVEARFSLAYNVAVSIISGEIFIGDFSNDAISRTNVIELSRKVFPAASPECEIPELGTHGKIKIEILLKDGSNLTGDVSYPKGNPRNPMDLKEIRAKFLKCVNYTGNEILINNANNIYNNVRQLTEPNYVVDDFTRLIFF